jgi:hypothetical protein
MRIATGRLLKTSVMAVSGGAKRDLPAPSGETWRRRVPSKCLWRFSKNETVEVSTVPADASPSLNVRLD